MIELKKKLKYPSLYQVNTRVWLTELSEKLGRRATLDDIPDAALDKFVEMGFDWIWFLSVWTTGPLAQKISRNEPNWRHDYEATLPDLEEKDIEGSGFAIANYSVHPELGGDIALKRLRSRLKKRGLKLMLDFVPNHMGPDHIWVEKHPEYFILGTEKDLQNNPQNFMRINNIIFAFGRDPYFSGWPDTVQLDYSKHETVVAMSEELLRISSQCDGLRCDMAMLILPDIFEKTWGRRAQSFWPEAIKKVHEKNADFIFLAEVYWDMEWELQQLGFDYTYDKRLYDRLKAGQARPVREHFFAGLDFQNKLARFLENHDEQRAAKTFKPGQHEAAAIITFLSPGLRIFHQGQFKGKRKRISPHLIRGPKEDTDKNIQSFYLKFLNILKNPTFRNGRWLLLRCMPAWENNNSWDSFLAFAWEGLKGKLHLVVVNYAPFTSQCLVSLPFSGLNGKKLRFIDLMSTTAYEYDGNEIAAKGLFVDMEAWAYHVFELTIS